MPKTAGEKPKSETGKYYGSGTELFSMLLAFGAALIALSVARNGASEQILATLKAQGGMDILGTDFEALMNSLIHDGRLNGVAALLAASSTFVQVIAFMIQSYRERHVTLR
jgi:hypothetical protein